MRAPALGVLGVFLVLAGCADPVSTSRFDGPVTITPSTQWSGGTVTVTTDQLLNYAATPVITAGSDTLAVTVVDDTTLSVTAPSVPTGRIELVAHGLADDLSLGMVEVVGFAGVIQQNGQIFGLQLPWPRENPTGILSTWRTSTGPGDVVYLHASTGGITHTGLTVTSSSDPGVAFSYRSGIFTTVRYDTLEFWSWPHPPGGTISTAGQVVMPMSTANTNFEIAPWTFFLTFHHFTQVLRSPDNGASWTCLYDCAADPTENVTHGIAFNQDGSLVASWAEGSPYGMPVFDVAAGTLRYRVPTLFQTAFGAFFTPDGELYAAGDSVARGGILLRLNATSATELGRVELGDRSIYGIAESSSQDRVYALLKGETISLLILNHDLAVQAELKAPPDLVFPGSQCWGATVIPDSAAGKVYAISCAGEIIAFDLLT